MSSSIYVYCRKPSWNEQITEKNLLIYVKGRKSFFDTELISKLIFKTFYTLLNHEPWEIRPLIWFLQISKNAVLVSQDKYSKPDNFPVLY